MTEILKIVYPTWLFIDDQRFISNKNYYTKNCEIVQKDKYSCIKKED